MSVAGSEAHPAPSGTARGSTAAVGVYLELQGAREGTSPVPPSTCPSGSGSPMRYRSTGSGVGRGGSSRLRAPGLDRGRGGQGGKAWKGRGQGGSSIPLTFPHCTPHPLATLTLGAGPRSQRTLRTRQCFPVPATPVRVGRGLPAFTLTSHFPLPPITKAGPAGRGRVLCLHLHPVSPPQKPSASAER